MSFIEIDTSRVQWPITSAVKEKMRKIIYNSAKERGYRYFATQTLRCLNGIENSEPDLPPLPGWEYLTFLHDCEAEKVGDEAAVFSDVRVFARKDSPC